MVGRAFAHRPKVRFGYLQLGWSATELIHVEDLLGKRGWDAEYTVVAGPPINLITAYAAGKLDACNMSTALVANMWERNIPLKVIGMATSHQASVLARKESGIKELTELKGKKLAAIPGGTTFFELRAMAKLGYNLDIDKEVKIVTATAPPDLVTLMEKGEVDAAIVWQPMTSQLMMKGRYIYLAKMVDMWQKATGRRVDYPIYVVYIANPDFIKKNPRFAKDLNDAQREAVEIWNRDRARTIRAVVAITKLKLEEAEFAYDHTMPMLSGLTEEQIETFLLQMALLREAGYLKSAFWDDRGRVKRELFWRG